MITKRKGSAAWLHYLYKRLTLMKKDKYIGTMIDVPKIFKTGASGQGVPSYGSPIVFKGVPLVLDLEPRLAPTRTAAPPASD